MEVVILSKQQFDAAMANHKISDENVEERHSLFISINDANGSNEQPYFKRNHSNVLIQYFDDVDEDMSIPIIGTNEFKKCTAFTLDQAVQILEFINLPANKSRKQCIVHCAAGVSRSGAVGTFINDYFKGNYFDFKKLNPNIHPNNHIIRTLKNVAK
jgi:predicted protein tyrosine phosphatase